MQITRIINPYRTANTYILPVSDKRVVIVDVGGPSILPLTNWLHNKKCRIQAVLLTHEHADHCLGVNALRELYDFELYCSKACADNIRKSRQNFSFYVEEIPTFVIDMPVNLVTEKDGLNFNGIDVHAIETPGHSPGGMCYRIGNAVFTGDTLLNGISPPLTFPHSDKALYSESLKKLSYFVKPGMVIYPGHGEHFIMQHSFSVVS